MDTKEKIKNCKELLIVVDMVNGFIKEGPLSANSIMRIVPKQKKVIQKFIDNPYGGVIFIRDAHDKNAIEFKRYPCHCLKNSRESQLIKEFSEFEDKALSYEKNSTNLIFTLESDLLSWKNLKKVYVVGCLSEICVFDGAIGLRTFFDEHNMDIDVYVYEDMIDTYDAPNHLADIVNEEALKWMELKGVKVMRKDN